MAQHGRELDKLVSEEVPLVLRVSAASQLERGFIELPLCGAKQDGKRGASRGHVPSP